MGASLSNAHPVTRFATSAASPLDKAFSNVCSRIFSFIVQAGIHCGTFAMLPFSGFL